MRALNTHTGAQRHNFKPKRLQYGKQQAVLFKAIATPLFVNQLLHQSLWLKRHRSTQQNVQILEGNRAYVRGNDRVKRR